ncbi:oxalate-binding protein [Clostridia bacterium]|nr:oxalate-binding protein [Clostridia bacterium]
MIKKSDEFREERRVIAGGKGEIILRHRFERDDMMEKCRLFAELTIEPGNSIGEHAHVEDMEIFYVLEGELVSIGRDGSETPFRKGDAMLTGGGDFHSLRNDSDKPAKMLAVIAL